MLGRSLLFWASPNVYTVPFCVTIQQPPPSGVDSMPLTGDDVPVAEPKLVTPPTGYTVPLAPISQ